MKIIYISPINNLSGSGVALLNIIKAIQTSNIDIYVVLPNKSGTLSKELIKLGINCIFTPIYLDVFPPRKTLKDIILYIKRLFLPIINNLISTIRLLIVLKKIKPDIIHTNVGPIYIGSFLAKITNTCHVWHLREFQDLDFGLSPIPSKNTFKKELKNKNNCIIAVTKSVMSHYNLNENTRVIYDGVFDINKIPEIKTNKKNYFLFVGNLHEGKGIRDAIIAFKETSKKYPNYQLWIAGDGLPNYVKYLNLLVEDLGLIENIIFLGFRNDIYSLMSEAIALIVPSRYEAFGFITAEAMYNGCLVIGNNTAGTKEQFDNGLKLHGEEIGIRFSGIQGLINSMNYICKEGICSYFQTLERAQQTVIELYSTKTCGKNILNLYKSLIN